jgi:hypothetical protein
MTPSNMEVSAIEGNQVPTGVYEAVLPPTESLVGMGVIVFLCIACAWYWNEKVVPVSRTNLAISKSRGEVKQYLDELRATDRKMSQANVTSSSTTLGDDVGPENDMKVSDAVISSQSSDRAFERWLFSDWLQDNKSERRAGRKKEPALPILKDAKWNSGDNPVVVAAALMVFGLTITAFTERISTSL